MSQYINRIDILLAKIKLIKLINILLLCIFKIPEWFNTWYNLR